MSRNRTIYQSETLVTSVVTGQATGVNLIKLTDASASVEISRRDVNIFGKLAAIDRPILDEPQVTLDFNYYLTNGENESKLGFAIDGSTSFLSGQLSNSTGANRNFFMVTVPEGQDAHGITPSGENYYIVGLGNAFISKYTVDAKVGEIPTASLSADCSNISFGYVSGYTGGNWIGTGVKNPAIVFTGSVPESFTGAQGYGVIGIPTINVTGDGDVTVIRPGDIVLDFDVAGTAGDLDMGGAILEGTASAATKQSAHVNSITIDVPMSRTPLTRLGNHFSFSKELDVPINITLSATADLADISTGSLVDLICAGSEERDISVTLYGPCDAGTTPMLKYTLKGATLDSQSLSSSIGSNKSVDLKFTAQIGGVNDQTKGLFVSGAYNG